MDPPTEKMRVAYLSFAFYPPVNSLTQGSLQIYLQSSRHSHVYVKYAEQNLQHLRACRPFWQHVFQNYGQLHQGRVYAKRLHCCLPLLPQYGNFSLSGIYSPTHSAHGNVLQTRFLLLIRSHAETPQSPMLLTFRRTYLFLFLSRRAEREIFPTNYAE